MAGKGEEHREAWLHRRHAFGINSDVADNIHFIDDSTCVYPIGRNIAIYSMQATQQKFIVGNERCDGITAMALSPNKKYLAVAESGDPPMVTIYDTGTRRKKKTLAGPGAGVPELSSREYVAVAFSADGKVLITQGGAPDWCLVYWAWDRNRAIASVLVPLDKAAAAQDRKHVSCISVCPKDPSLVCVSGSGLFRFFKVSEGVLKPAPGGIGKREMQNYLAHAWLPPDDRIVVSTETGDLLLIENFELRCVLHGSPSEGLSIDAIVAYAKGFICGGDMGLVFIFERSDDKDVYRKMKAMRVEYKRDAETLEADTMKVRCFALTQQEEFLALTTTNNQVFLLNLSNADFSKGEDAVFEPLSQSFHSGPITGLATCVRKPLVATCSKDRSIKIWNHSENTLEMSRTFHTEATSIALHPSGLHVLVGFSDKLRFMNLYSDDIREFKSFPIRQCTECRFSSGGQYFAAVHGNIISIYNTYTCETIGHLRGHNGKVRSLFWMSPDDTKLVSVGMDGAVFDWSLKDCRKENDYVIKSAHYTSVTAGAPGTSASASPLVWAVAADRKLREFELANLHAGPLQEPDTGDSPLSVVAFCAQQKLLLCGSEDGSVSCIPVPLASGVCAGSPLWETNLAHSSPITRIALTFDESVLFTAGEDGVLYMYDVRDKDGRSAKREITYAEEILISKTDLEDKNNEISTQRAKVDDLKLDMEYQAQKHKIQHVKEMKTLEDEHREQSERQYQKFEQLLALKNEQEIEFMEIRRETSEKHRGELQKLEADYQTQLQMSEDQIGRCQNDLDDQRRHYLNQLSERESNLERTKREEEDSFQRALQVEKETCDSLQHQEKFLRSEHEEVRLMIENMTDQDIEEMKEKFERKLREAREQLLHLKGENGIMKKKFYTLLKDIKDKETEIGNLFESQGEKEGKIKGLEKDIEALKNEIRERDETIGDKEKRIYDLKKKNQELEKFKFVLDYKIRELKSQIEPRQVEIAEAKQKIKAMDGELERYHQNNNQLILTINDLKLKLDGQLKEIGNLHTKLQDTEAYKSRIRQEVSDLATIGQEPKLLREAAKRLYQKHVKDDVRRHNEVEEDVQKENNRQRDYLERTVESLKKKLVKDSDTHRADAGRIMNENVVLIQEVNQLRREVKVVRSQMAQVVPAAGIPDALRSEMDTNKTEIQRLRDRLDELDKMQHAFGRPAPKELPPTLA